jgi:hypothetical protein
MGSRPGSGRHHPTPVYLLDFKWLAPRIRNQRYFVAASRYAAGGQQAGDSCIKGGVSYQRSNRPEGGCIGACDQQI